MTDKNSVKINIPEGMEIDASKSTFHEIFFKPKEKTIPRTWEELNTTVLDMQNNKAYIALTKLLQLQKVYNGENYEPQWEIYGAVKWYISIKIDNTSKIGKFKLENEYDRCVAGFVMKNLDTAKLFLANFEDLLKEASPLLFGYTFKD